MSPDPSSLQSRRVPLTEDWDSILRSLPEPHLLQSAAWGDFKGQYGWSPERWAWSRGGGAPVGAAQVLRRAWPARQGIPGFSILYVPRGPVLDWSDRRLAEQILADLTRLAAPSSVLAIQLEPDRPFSEEAEQQQLMAGWFRSAQPVQFGSTMILDLTPPLDDLLAGMKPKTRYNIRLAGRRGVTIREGTAADLDQLYDMYAETSVRDGFVIRPVAYYRRAWGDFLAAGTARAFLAGVDGEPVAGLIVYRFRKRAWFLYGMSRDRHRDRMPNHALQWAAIEWARASGCTTYDLWGAPDALDPEDPLWGVYRFKEGFGANHVRLIGSWEYTARPGLHRIFRTTLPRVLSWTRRRQQARTRRLLDPAG